MQFILKARAEYADLFREAFRQMEATFEERFVGDCKEVIAFTIECASEKISILQKLVPIEAFANIGLAGRPPV